MSIIDRIRGLFGRKPSAAESVAGVAVLGAGVAAASDDDSVNDVDLQSESAGFSGGDAGAGWSGDVGGGDDAGGGGGGGG